MRHKLSGRQLSRNAPHRHALMRNLATRHPRSLRVCTLLRKPDAVRTDVDISFVGFDIPNEFVVGYGLDYAERYRDLPYIGRLKPSVYEH